MKAKNKTCTINEPGFYLVYQEGWEEDAEKFSTLPEAEARAEQALGDDLDDSIYILIPIHKVRAEEETTVNIIWEDL